MMKGLTVKDSKEWIKWMGIGAIAFGMYYLGQKIFSSYIHKNNQQKSNLKKSRAIQSQVSTEVSFSQYYFDRNLSINQLVDKIGKKSNVEKIYLESVILAEEEFLKYTQEIRKRRRLIRKVNQEQYINIVLDYQSEIKDLMVRCRLDLLDALQIFNMQFEKMEDQYDVLEGLKDLEKEAQKKLRSFMRKKTNRKIMTDQKMNLIVDDQIVFIENKMYNRLRKKMQQEIFLSQQQILKVCQALLEDIIYQKYGFQSEDLQIKLENHSARNQECNFFMEKMEADIAQFNYDSFENSVELEDKNNKDYDFSQKTITNAEESESSIF